MTTFIKTKFKKSDDQINIGKYRVASYIKDHFQNNYYYVHIKQL